ncbi:p24 complex component [Tilletia horrida]|uniref:P24 complex component n=1 Tax=Tilletia horrida TaxID=155126 RepID=A0AAN6JTH6_9BASI|nr:p24 complex component [Tilletia horrida]KAK0550065.1 p24 complex component [Tilletia horrida]KAK0565083.1 p24 complex component [Tilletia horrida]
MLPSSTIRRRAARSAMLTVSLVSTLLALLACYITPAAAHMIELGPSSKECFFEDLHVNDQMTLTYQVSGGGHLDVDTWLTDPHNTPLYQVKRKDTGTYSFTATKDGRYTYCFSNEFSSVADKTVSWNVHGVIYVPDEGTMLPIEREIRDLSAHLQAVKDEQAYLVIRERVHRNTADSTNARVKWWSILQGLMLIGVCSTQVYFVKRQFEVRRVV